VKRYLHEKRRFIQRESAADEHVLIVPGAASGMESADRSRTYWIASPLVSRTTGYRALLNLRAVDEILERERPGIIESADPYQLGWHTAAAATMFRIPAVAFYHSHFPEAYLTRGGEPVQAIARRYVRALYNKFAATFAPSNALTRVLQQWGVRNVITAELGVETSTFHPADDAAGTRQQLNLPPTTKLLLYVGRLAPEKNTAVNTGALTWLPYCADPAELARYYRAADLFVHPGTRETFGLVAVEAQACGTPVIGFAGSRLDDVIEHDQQFWAQRNDATALAQAIVVATQHDLQALGRGAAIKVAQRFAWPLVFDRLFCIYREVCSQYGSATR
jgi:alpha-1,6-mannosyltransferase